MSKTNATPTPAPANQSVPASNDVPASATSSKPAFNYAAAAARSAGSSRLGAHSTAVHPSTSSPTSSASAAGSNPPPNPLTTSNKPSLKTGDASPAVPRPINGSAAAAATRPSAAPVSESRRTSVAGVKGHNVKPSASHIAFGSLADLPAKSDAAAILSSSPANPPTLSRREGPPVFGSVPTESGKKVDKPPVAVASVAPPASVASTKTDSADATVVPPPKREKKPINFESFFRAGGETAPSQPPPPPSNGSSPSPSMAYRQDPTQNRRNNTLDTSNAPHANPVSPRPSHLGIPNGPGPNAFHSPLSGASRAFTPGQSQPQSQPPHQYGPNHPHWQGGQPPSSPHFVPSGPPHNNMPPNYSHPNGAMAPPHNSQSQFMQKPAPFPHRNGPNGQSGGPSGSMFPPNGRSNINHHQQRGTMQAPPSPRLPPSGGPNGNTPGPSPAYQPSPNSQPMGAAYWAQAPYPGNGPAPYPGYGYNPNTMPTYPHPGNFPPPHAQHSSPQLTHQPGPPSAQPVPPLNVPSLPSAPARSQASGPPIPPSPAPSNASFHPSFPPTLYSPSGTSHSRGPSLSYNAPSFNPTMASPEFKPRPPNVAAPAFHPRKSAAIQIKKPAITPTAPAHEGTEKADDDPSRPTAKPSTTVAAEGSASALSTDTNKPSKNPTESKTQPVVQEPVAEQVDLKSAPKIDADKKDQENLATKASELADEKVRAEEGKKAAIEAEAKQKADEEERLKKEAQEKADRDAKEQAEKDVKEQAEKGAKEQAEKDAKIIADQKAKDLLEKEAEPQPQKESSPPPAKAIEEDQPTSSTQRKSNETGHDVVASKPIETTPPTSTHRGSYSAPGLPQKAVNGAPVPSSNNKVRPTPIDVNAVPSAKRVNSSGETMSPALPSALSSARKIEDLGSVSYPENIKSPRPDLNIEAAPGKFRYDRAFLLQFMEVCKGKPTQLPDLDSIGLVDAQSASMNLMSRTQSTGGQRRNPGQMPPSGRGPSGPLTPSGGSMSSMMGPGGMPNRTGPGAGMPMFAAGANRTSEERFSQSNRAMLGAMPIGSGLMLPGRPTGQMSRTPSSNALPGMIPNGARDANRRSGRGSRRDGGPPMSTTNPAGMNRGMPLQQMFPSEVVEPLQSSANSWATARASHLDEDAPEMVNRKVRALLNKLTLDKFESISDQVIAWANKSEKETDGRILRQVIALIFEKATDEAHWSEMYAKLCRKLMEKLSLKVKDENVLDSNGIKVSGGQLFRKYLLNRCQEDYERGWSKRDELAAAAAGKAADDAVKQAANEKSRADAEAAGKEASKEAEILSDEYYAAQKAKRQGLGLVRFIGELFKLNMLTERIMHECIKKLLSNIDNPEEEDIESLCRLMMTVGQMLDHERAISHINVYFSRMATMAEGKNLSSRARFMIQDVIDTRQNHWVGRNVAAGPKLISQIHEEAAQAAAEQSRQAQAKQNMPKMNDMPRGGSRGGRNRDQYGNAPSADGWSSVGNAAPPPRPSKAGDLTHFGKLRDTSSSGRLNFGPSGVFANKGKLKDGKVAPEREPAVAVASNPFAALGADTGDSSGHGSSSGLSRKPSVPELAPSGRPKLNLAPRTLPLPRQTEEADSKVKAGDEATEKESEGDIIDDETAKRLVKTRLDEFFHVKSVEEGAASFKDLPKSRHYQLLQSLIEKVMDMKVADAKMTASLFSTLSSSKSVAKEAFAKAFEPVVEMLDDTVVDAPAAYNYCGRLLFAAGFEESEVKEMAAKIEAADVQEATRRLLDAFIAVQKE